MHLRSHAYKVLLKISAFSMENHGVLHSPYEARTFRCWVLTNLTYSDIYINKFGGHCELKGGVFGRDILFISIKILLPHIDY